MLIPLLLACAPEPVAFCSDGPRLRYEQGFEEGLTVWPDEHWAVEDASTRTGLRLELEHSHPALAGQPDNYADWFEFLSTLDGFGLTAGLFFRFDQALDPSVLDQVFLVALTEEGPVEVPVDARLIDLDATILMEPRRALPSATQVVAGLRTDPSEPGCAGPSSYLAELLDPVGRQVEHPLTERYQQGLEALDLAPDEVAAMSVFTTQSAHAQALEVVEIVQDEPYQLQLSGCTELGGYQRCEVTLEVADFRDEERLVPPGQVQVRDHYELPVAVWAPLEGGPWPVVVCGHGLGGDRYQCDAIVEQVTEQGVALVAIDAVEHGDHPTRSDFDIDLLESLAIFAIRVDPPGLHGLRLRDNFRQSAWDKLQLIEALRTTGLDLDGDGQSELDGSRMGYAGVSLGAIMGPEPLALSSDLRGGVLYVGGARITQIIQDSASFGVLIDLMKPADLSDGDVERAFPLLQTMVDPADPMIWAPYVQQDRLLGGEAPDIYVGAALDDEVVPNSTNELFALGFQPPGVGREVWPVQGIDFSAGDVAENGPGGASLGFVQFETITEDGVERAAEHANLHDSDQGLDAIEAFFRPILLEDGHGTILDPER